MGYDPDEAPHELLRNLQHAADTYGEGAVHELAAACKNETLARLDALTEAAQCRDLQVRVASYDTLSRRIADECSGLFPPWKRAREAARIARNTWNLDGPVATGVLADLFGIGPAELWERPMNGTRSLSVGLRDDDDPARMLICGICVLRPLEGSHLPAWWRTTLRRRRRNGSFRRPR